MSRHGSLLRAAHHIVLHNWPSTDVPDTLVRAGYAVTVYGGPAPDDIYVHELTGGEVTSHQTGVAPTSADVMYLYPWPGFVLADDLPRVASTASEIGATTLWYQSGTNASGEPDPRAYDLTPHELDHVRAVTTAAGLTLVHDAYIADEVRALSEMSG